MAPLLSSLDWVAAPDSGVTCDHCKALDVPGHLRCTTFSNEAGGSITLTHLPSGTTVSTNYTSQDSHIHTLRALVQELRLKLHSLHA